MLTITKFMRSKWPFIVVASRCFVPKSAQLSFPGNLTKEKCPSFSARWTHKVDVSRCLTLPHTRCCAVPSAAEEIGNSGLDHHAEVAVQSDQADGPACRASDPVELCFA